MKKSDRRRTPDRTWDAVHARERDLERRRTIEQRRQSRPARVPADDVYALLERISRRDSVVARGDPGQCALCGHLLTVETLTVDHIVARALGGEDGPDNLQATCVRCNNLKSRLEAAVREVRERGRLLPGAASAVLHDIRNRAERERFAEHPSVAALLQELGRPAPAPDQVPEEP